LRLQLGQLLELLSKNIGGGADDDAAVSAVIAFPVDDGAQRRDVVADVLEPPVVHGPDGCRRSFR
jgi:hypothetical protein